MKVMIVGNGGREHALTRQFAKSTRISGLYCAPGNAGTEQFAQNLPNLSSEDVTGIVSTAREIGVDLVFVGPEAPLALGLVDALRAAGIKAVGPDKKAAQLESSKEFTKNLLFKHRIPTAQAHIFHDRHSFETFVDTVDGPWVVKKSGLAAGKGVLESDDKAEMKAFAAPFFADGDSVVMEEYLRGFEVSIFGLSDGTNWKILPPAADYKKAGEKNTGPNTGGMGAICPVPWLDRTNLTRIEKELVEPVYRALASEGLMYKGILYFGVMITQSGPKILEFNVRFGDPEAQVLIPLIKSDFYALCEAMAEGKLKDYRLDIDQRTAIGVVVAAPGYPSDYKKDLEVRFTDYLASEEKLVFHASTYKDAGTVKTKGGRCFTMVGIGTDFADARSKAYSLADTLSFDGAWYRSDIGANIYSQKY